MNTPSDAAVTTAHNKLKALGYDIPKPLVESVLRNAYEVDSEEFSTGERETRRSAESYLKQIFVEASAALPCDAGGLLNLIDQFEQESRRKERR